MRLNGWKSGWIRGRMDGCMNDTFRFILKNDCCGQVATKSSSLSLD